MRRLDSGNLQVLAVAAGALLGIALPGLAPLVLLVIASVFLLVRLRFRRAFHSTPANLALACLAAILLINPLVSVAPSTTFPIAAQMLVGLCLVLSVSTWTRGLTNVRHALLALAAIGLLLVILAPFTVDWITDKYGFLPGAVYTWLLPLSRKVIHPNIMAGAVAVLLVTLVAFQRFAWRALRRSEHILLAIASFGLMVVLIATQSRGALFGAFFGLASMLALSFSARRLMPLALIGVLVLAVLLNGTGFDLGFVMDSSASIRGAPGRQEIWAHAAEVAADFPLTGIGLGNFPATTDLFYPFIIPGPDQSHAHNLLLQIAVDTGAPGLAAWLACLLLVLFCCLQTFHVWRAKENPLLVGAGAGLLCGQIAMLFHSLTDAPLWATRPTFILWILWGLALALPKISQAEAEYMTLLREQQAATP